MQKVVRFLEANVEWFALLLAIAYFGWATWAYLINDPVAKPLADGTQVSVGNVDAYIDTHAAQHLRDKMNPDVQPPAFDVKDFRTALQSSLNMDNIQPTQLAVNNFDYSPFDSTNLPGQYISAKGNPVQQLPLLPAAHALLALAGLDTLAPPAQVTGATPNTPARDVRLVVAAFTIPWTDLFDQWNKAFGPVAPGGQPRLTPAEFKLIQITAFRSEKIGDKWVDDPTPIQIINGADLPAYPPAGNKQAELSYLEALQKSPKTIATPDIPAVVAGAQWKDVIQFLPGATDQQNNPTPPADQNGGQSMLPGSQYPRTAEMSNRLNAVDVQYGGPPGGGGGFRGGGPPPGWRPPVAPAAPPSDQTPPDQQQPAPAIPPADGTVTPVTVLANPNAAPGQAVPQEVSPNLNLIAMQPKMPDLCIYVIDQTAAAGKTYRYRIVYKVLNPLYNKGAQHVAPAHAAWLNQFDITAPMSDYSPEITVPRQTYFFCGQPKGTVRINNNNSFPFDVFTWSNGKWQKDTFTANQGDPIGGIVGSINYSTGYTYVDKRPGRAKTFVTLVDREGDVEIRDAAADGGSPDYKKVTQWVAQPAGSPGQPAPVVPGGPGGPGGPGNPYAPGGNNLPPGVVPQVPPPPG